MIASTKLITRISSGCWDEWQKIPMVVVNFINSYQNQNFVNFHQNYPSLNIDSKDGDVYFITHFHVQKLVNETFQKMWFTLLVNQRTGVHLQNRVLNIIEVVACHLQGNWLLLAGAAAHRS